LSGIEFKEELFVQLRELSLGGDLQKLCGHHIEYSQVTETMLDQCFLEWAGHEMLRCGLLQSMVEIGHEVLLAEGFQDKPRAYSGPQRAQLLRAHSFGKSRIPAQDGSQDTLGVEVGAGEQPYFIKTGGHHLLGLIDEEDGPKEGGLDVVQPAFSEGFEASIAVSR